MFRGFEHLWLRIGAALGHGGPVQVGNTAKLKLRLSISVTSFLLDDIDALFCEYQLTDNTSVVSSVGVRFTDSRPHTTPVKRKPYDYSE